MSYLLGLSYYVYRTHDLRSYNLSRFYIDDTSDSGDNSTK